MFQSIGGLCPSQLFVMEESMVRLPKDSNMKINVILKNGEQFLRKDIINQPFGENEKLVYFWLDDIIRVYPMGAVEYMELVPEEA